MALCLCCSVTPITANEIVRLGTGGNGGTYFPIGSLFASCVNEKNIKVGGDKELIILPQRSNGSAANLIDLSQGLLEAALAQADLASLAYNQQGPFANTDPDYQLRTLGTLYLESVHLVVATDKNIASVSDLVGKTVSVDVLGSGTQLDVIPLLDASGVNADDFQPVYLKPVDSIDRMRRGLLDAFFVIAGYPLKGVTELVDDGVGRVIGLNKTVIEQLSEERAYFSSHTIPKSTYSTTEDIMTLSVSAQIIVRADLDDDIVYQMTKTLWSDRTLQTLADGHPRGSDIKTDTALLGVGLPLHRGSLRYYREHGFDYEVFD